MPSERTVGRINIRIIDSGSADHEHRVHCGVGNMQSRIPLSLHQSMAQDKTSLPARQQRLGIPEIRPIKHTHGQHVNQNHQTTTLYQMTLSRIQP